MSAHLAKSRNPTKRRRTITVIGQARPGWIAGHAEYQVMPFGVAGRQLETEQFAVVQALVANRRQHRHTIDIVDCNGDVFAITGRWKSIVGDAKTDVINAGLTKCRPPAKAGRTVAVIT